MNYQCALCEHFCTDGIKFMRKGRLIFRCSECKHETTLVRVPSDLKDSMEDE